MAGKWACDGCHKRKIQCDRTSPRTPCDWCEHHNLLCTFSRARRGKTRMINSRNVQSRPPPVPAATLPSNGPPALVPNEQLNSLDATIFPIIQHDTTWQGNVPYRDILTTSHEQPPISSEHALPHPKTRSPRIVTKPFGQIYYGGCHLGQISLDKGIPQFSEEGRRWIFSKTGDNFKSETLHRPSALHSPVALSQGYSGASLLPSRHTTHQVIAAYLNSTFKFAFPFIDGTLFSETIVLAYEGLNVTATLDHLSARCCFLAFLSIIDCFRGPNDFPDIDPEACSMEAQHLLTEVLLDTNLMGIQTVLMLQLHEAHLGRMPTAAILNGVACKMVITLGGNIDVPSLPDHGEASREDRERCHLRALFWICYLFDKEIALRSGQPPFLTDSYCDLTPPDKGMTHFFTDGTNEGLFPYLFGDIGLSLLKGKANHQLYSVHASRKPDAELLHDIRELDEQLEEWRSSMPSHIRPSLSMSRSSLPSLQDTDLHHRMHAILVHLEYFYLLITIHHASGRCTTMSPMQVDTQGSSAAALDSSLALCLEASRSTIVYLKATISCLATETFWIVQFYPTVAIITLFLNILMNPLDSQAHKDLELLASAADIFRLMPARQYTPQRLDQVQMLERFVIELARLGRCAVYKKEAELGCR
ncbi:Zn(2)-C6 fungal-type domain-containing protein [Fusarium sp. LHS14.1]|nr:Zn(2)-C6 fungal-type domain-containing protein [Fusarium sp. LHS14.1]